MKSTKSPMGLIYLMVIVHSSIVASSDWPCFRGVRHDGVSKERMVWPKAGPKLRWKASVGFGHSSAAVVGERVYTVGNANRKTDTVWCLDVASGEVVWKYSYPCRARFAIVKYDGPGATPSVSGNFVYTFSRMGDLFCFEARSGKVMWQKDVKKMNGRKVPRWGYSGSPLVLGSQLILNVGSGGLALNPDNGEMRWASPPGFPGYATPVPLQVEGVPCVSLFTGTHLMVVQVKDGKKVWETPWKHSAKINAADPIVEAARVFVSSGRKMGGAVFDVVSGKTLWKGKDMSNHWHTCVLWKGHLYGTDGNNQKGKGRSPNALKCLDWKNGTVKWSAPSMGFSGIIVVDGTLLCLTDSGYLVAVDASPQEFKERGRKRVLKSMTFTAPVYAGGKVYIRSVDGDLLCLEMKLGS